MRKPFYILTVAMLLSFIACPIYADDVILIQLSYKIVLNPENGSRPSQVSDDDIDQAIEAMNALLESYSRGFRFQRVDPVTPVGGIGDTSGPSQWYDTNFHDDDDGGKKKDKMEEEALDKPALYAWNEKAINLYVTNGICGGLCSRSSSESLIIIGGCSANNSRVQLHEIGHFFNLCHTQGCGCDCCTAMKTGECNTDPGNDKIDDTLPDLACWGTDNISIFWFGKSFQELSSAQQDSVLNVFSNIMSYRNTPCAIATANLNRMTELQLDRWTDSANNDRRHVANGRTYFVEFGGGSGGSGSRKSPFRS
ncbi:MAG: hypothetical protein MN733_01885, partial [Nitrososphaera sp.]|nr:hypothetical protein [Nitrososphaera sp.]